MMTEDKEPLDNVKTFLAEHQPVYRSRYNPSPQADTGLLEDADMLPRSVRFKPSFTWVEIYPETSPADPLSVQAAEDSVLPPNLPIPEQGFIAQADTVPVEPGGRPSIQPSFSASNPEALTAEPPFEAEAPIAEPPPRAAAEVEIEEIALDQPLSEPEAPEDGPVLEPAAFAAAGGAPAGEAAPMRTRPEPEAPEDGPVEQSAPDTGPLITVIPPEPKKDNNTILHILEVSGLHKQFGRKEVVRGVNFSMHNGEVAGLLGPNGAGKTTIFYMIVGFYKPTKGKVLMDGVDITTRPMFRRARLGVAYLPQEASIFRKLTVEQNIWAILESRREINKAAKKERLEALLEEFGIGRIRKQYGFTLSGGERRRTEIARALATEPKFLLLDEPFAGIDPIAVYEIKQIIRRLAEKDIGILITDHNVRDTLEITTEAFIINMGTIVARGDKDIILANEMVREVYLGSEFRM
jgi:lipopolysaccharide export system ATP-binding protein